MPNAINTTPMPKYKIAMVCDWYLPRIGGLELHLHDLANELNKAGHEVHIICSYPGPAGMIGNTRIHRLTGKILPFLKTIRSRSAVTEVEELLLREKFDIIHAHSVYSPLSLVGIYLADKLGIPSLFTEHSVLRGPSSLMLGSLNRLWPWTQWPTLLLGVSQVVAQDLTAVSKRPEDVAVLHNAINPSEWQVVDRQEQQPLRVTAVMRLAPRKRPTDLIRMIPAINRQLKPLGIKPIFTIIGDGSERRRVEREIKRLRLGAQVELLGFQPRDVVRNILSQSAIFVLPTIREAMSIASLEARCVGVPVVAMNQGGVGDVITHGEHGFLASNSSEFVDYVVNLLSDSALRVKISKNALNGIDKFGWPFAINRYTEYSTRAIQRNAERKLSKSFV